MARTIAPAVLAELLGDGWRRPGVAATALADALRALVVDGRLAVRTRVPSERALAPVLGVGRGTVSRAYDRLRDEGFLVSDRGAGSHLALPGDRGPAGPPDVPGLSRGVPALDLTIAALRGPEPWLSAAAAQAAAALPRFAASLGYTGLGLPELREAIAARFSSRGAPTSADQILVTSGAQHALHLVLRLLCAPGDRALVDAPTYPRTLSALTSARVRAVGVPLRERGWDAEAWAHTIAAAAPRVALTIPDFQNPTGLVMAVADREGLARTCARAGVVLVADETTAELRLDGPAVPPPLAAHDPGGAVVTIGSMSKGAWGGLRLGWVRASPRLVRDLATLRGDLDMSSPLLEQLVAVSLMEHWDDVLASRRELLRVRRAALLDALAEYAPAWTLRRPRGGLSAWVRLPAPVATALASAAARERVLITAGPAFSVDGTFEHHLRLPYTAAPAALRDGVRTLARVADGLTGTAAGNGTGVPVAEPALVTI